MKKLLISLSIILSLFILPLSINADTGPKPSVKVIVQNTNDENYYLAFLEADLSELKTNAKTDNLDPEMVKKIIDFSDNYKSIYFYETPIPRYQNSLYNEENTYYLTYTVPSNYKLLIVDKNLNARVTPVINHSKYNQVLTLDYETMTVKPSTSETIKFVLTYLFITVIATLIIEFLLLMAFHLTNKHNNKLFLITNILTQGILYLLINLGFFRGSYGLYLLGGWTVIYLVPIELIIILVELGIYHKKMQGNKKIITLYTIVANLASAIIGTALISLI